MFASSRKITSILSDGFSHEFGSSSMLMSVAGNTSTMTTQHAVRQHNDELKSQIPISKDSQVFNSFDKRGSQASTPDSVPSLKSQNSAIILRSDHPTFLSNNGTETVDSIQNPLSMAKRHIPHSHGTMMLRPKSDNIAIKRGRTEDELMDVNSIERMYDFATWRMFHRITAARRSRSAVPQIHRNDESSDDDQLGMSLESEYPLNDPRRTKSLNDLNLDGEVFVLDL